MTIRDFAAELQSYLSSLPEVKACRLYGSLSTEEDDEYSDIDMEVDVSGTDNGAFITELPARLAERYSVIFCDYAPSLAPEKYIVTLALHEDAPFMLLDITCTATPHVASRSKQDIRALNDGYDHTLKLFAANLKHHLRGADCHADILKMHDRIFGKEHTKNDKQMLTAVYGWLDEHAEDRHRGYVAGFAAYMEQILA